VNACGLLKMANDREQAFRCRIAFHTEHSHQALGGLADFFGKLLEANGRVDIITKDELSGINVPVEEELDGFGQKGNTKSHVTVGAGFDGLFEISG
tara:strand:+ start:484 stop:771 length:288 start_codon:yes stop_codon:yes gene_type:complete